MALPVGISSSGSVFVSVINISHHIRLSSFSKEMMQNENRRVVIKAFTLLAFSHLNTTNAAKKKNPEARLWSLLPSGAAMLHELLLV